MIGIEKLIEQIHLVPVSSLLHQAERNTSRTGHIIAIGNNEPVRPIRIEIDLPGIAILSRLRKCDEYSLVALHTGVYQECKIRRFLGLFEERHIDADVLAEVPGVWRVTRLSSQHIGMHQADHWIASSLPFN